MLWDLKHNLFLQYFLIYFIQESTITDNENDENHNKFQENVLYNAQYRELIALINYQREKLSSQQADLTKVNYGVTCKFVLYYLYYIFSV